MKQFLRAALGLPASRRPLLFLALTITAAIYAGFFAVTPAQAERLIVRGGYYYIFGVFALWLLSAWRLVSERWMSWRDRRASARNLGIILVGATAFAVWTD